MLSTKLLDLQDNFNKDLQDDKNFFIFGSQKKLGTYDVLGSENKIQQGPMISPIGVNKKVFTIPKVETTNVQSPEIKNEVNVNTPEIKSPLDNIQTTGIELKTPSVDLGNIDVPNNSISMGNPNLPPALDFNFADLKIPDVQNGVALPDLSEVANTIKTNLGMDISSPNIQADIPKVNSELLNHIGDTVQPAIDVINSVSKPIQTEINNQVNNLKDVLGYGEDLLNDTSIRKGTGTGYGEVKLSDGVVLDVSKPLDNVFSTVSQGTPLEGVSGSDVYSLATNPSNFIENKGQDVAKNILTDNMGLDKSTANDVVQAITDPQKFVEQKGVEAVSNMIGVDSGLVNALTSGDIGKAAEGIAKNVVSNTVVSTIARAADAIIPGAGVALEIIAQIVKYSCYLSTSAYYNKYITKEDYIDFTKYRIAIQSKSFLSNRLWAGYICGFEKIYSHMLYSKRFSSFIFKFITKPFMGHVKWTLGKGKFSIISELVAGLLWVYCIVNYLIQYKKASRILRAIDHKSTVNVYKHVLRII